MKNFLVALIVGCILAGGLVAYPDFASAQETIRCESDGEQYKFCPIDYRADVRLVRQLSHAPCDQNKSWGYDSRGIWVDRGCRAEFEVSRRHSDSGYRQGGFQLKGRAEGHCKLTDVKAGAELYNGTCKIKETIDSKGMTVFSIKMAKFKDPFLFAGQGGTWMHGPEEVTFRDRGDHAIFRWAKFRLEVHED